jgi:protein XagA
MGKDAARRRRGLMRAAALFVAGALIAPQPICAGAWTLDHGQFQVFSGVTVSRATRRFDGTSDPTQKVVFNKLFVQNWMEYGLTDAVTLFAAPEYILADSGMAGAGVDHTRASSVEAGARILLLSRIGMLSVQMSGKTAGAFNMSTSVGGQSGRQIELRLLYGCNFRLLRRDGYLDLQVAERWIKRPRPNEMTIDATAALWLTRRYLLMFQSFNTIAGGGARPPYEFYRQHKLQASLLQRLGPRWSLQTGVFVSPAGQNIVQEQGVVTQLWYRY